jgi:AcrR family transcriptional regulator
VKRTVEEATETRRAIVRAARRLFAEQGFAATSTTAIVEAAGVTRGALYHHFADKADVFRVVFTGIEGELDDAVTEAALAEHTARGGFTAGCRALLDFMVRRDYHQIAVVDAPSVLGSVTWHDTDAGFGLDTLEAGLAALEREGALRMPASAAQAVMVYGALTEAGIVLSRGGPKAPSRDELVDAIIDLICVPDRADGQPAG